MCKKEQDKVLSSFTIFWPVDHCRLVIINGEKFTNKNGMSNDLRIDLKALWKL